MRNGGHVTVQDWSTGRSHTFDFGDTQVVQEMVFVPKPGTTAEQEAWLMGPSINLKTGVTELYAFDLGAGRGRAGGQLGHRYSSARWLPRGLRA